MKKSEIRIILTITVLLSFICGSVGVFVFSLVFPQDRNRVILIGNKQVDEEDTISKGVLNVYDSVVVVEGFSEDNLASTGTGFIYRNDGKKAYIMTNHHVVAGVSQVKVVLSDKREIEATVRGSEAYSDIAVLVVDASAVQHVAVMGDSSKVRVGDTVFTVGSPEGADYAGTVTKGILSGKDRLVAVALSNDTQSDYYLKVLQTDAAINPGNSGGPICNINGEVIGITNMKLVDSKVEGIGFAIPIEDAIYYASVLEKGDVVERPYLGIGMLDVSNSYYLWQNGINVPSSVKEGVVVTEVSSNSPARRAGLKKGDIILSLGGEKVSGVAELRYYLYQHQPGEKVSIEIMRNNRVKKMEVKLSRVKN